MKHPSNLLSPVLAVLAAWTSPAAVMGADDPQTTKPLGEAALPGTPPMIIHNPDGTFTIQKAPPKDGTKGTAKKGLVIPAQVVIPIIPARKKQK
ncbi:MAG: hypothetical protein ABSC05_33100 [Candidatus Solibacter sp.]|jgi:hypothetical protein